MVAFHASKPGAFAIDSGTGTLSPVDGSPFPGPAAATGIAMDPSGNFLYVSGFNSYSMQEFRINPETGSLTFESQILTQDSPAYALLVTGDRPVVYVPRFAYVTNEGANTVTGYTLSGQTGALTLVPGSLFFAGASPSSIATSGIIH